MGGGVIAHIAPIDYATVTDGEIKKKPYDMEELASVMTCIVNGQSRYNGQITYRGGEKTITVRSVTK